MIDGGARGPVSSAAVLAAGAIWASAVAAGFAALAAYERRPGEAATAPPRWPAGSALPRDPDRAAVVLFAHPRCPCTRASLAELGALSGRLADRARVVVAALVPDGVAPGWVEADGFTASSDLARAELFLDRGGIEARRFGAATSGQVLAYGAGGELIYAGGVTGGRGQRGGSVGRAGLLAAVEAGVPAPCGAAVFGCPLRDPPGEPARWALR